MKAEKEKDWEQFGLNGLFVFFKILKDTLRRTQKNA